MSTCITPVGFKSGKDLAGEPGIDEEEQVTCVECSATATDQAAYERGWQLVPAVCPDCLRWVATARDSCCHGSPA